MFFLSNNNALKCSKMLLYHEYLQNFAQKRKNYIRQIKRNEKQKNIYKRQSLTTKHPN